MSSAAAPYRVGNHAASVEVWVVEVIPRHRPPNPQALVTDHHQDQVDSEAVATGADLTVVDTAEVGGEVDSIEVDLTEVEVTAEVGMADAVESVTSRMACHQMVHLPVREEAMAIEAEAAAAVTVVGMMIIVADHGTLITSQFHQEEEAIAIVTGVEAEVDISGRTKVAVGMMTLGVVGATK